LPSHSDVGVCTGPNPNEFGHGFLEIGEFWSKVLDDGGSIFEKWFTIGRAPKVLDWS
jgi:hypothetical protein